MLRSKNPIHSLNGIFFIQDNLPFNKNYFTFCLYSTIFTSSICYEEIMKMLYAPWRTEYTSDTHEGKNEDSSQETCVFCKQFASNNDLEYGIIKRFKHTIIVLNKYPYNAGHVLLLPIAHVPSISTLSQETRLELINALGISIDTIKQALGCDGLNVGMNLGTFAGAGIPTHLHIHILPRWKGDTNFMPTIAETKVISFDMKEIYQKLNSTFKNVSI